MTANRTIVPQDDGFTATVEVPGDKSLSHRALIFAGLATGTSNVHNLGSGADVAATASVLQALGVRFGDGRITSPGVEGWKAPAVPLDCGNSGTTMRTLAGALAARPYSVSLTGDDSLRTRPMRRLVRPIEALGGRIGLTDGGTPPITIGPAEGLTGTRVELDIASAQVRTAFELAAIQAEGVSHIASPPGFRDHTERWLDALGLGERLTVQEFRVYPGPVPPIEYRVPGDASSAAYMWTAAAVRRGSVVTTPGITLNPGRIGFLQVLEQMGAGVEAEVTSNVLGDPIGTVTVRGRRLKGTSVSGSLVVASLDELPLVAVLAGLAEGITTVSDAAELRVKETDRIEATCEMVRALGGGAEETSDGFEILGVGWFDGGVVDSRGDHRIAMAAGVAGTVATGPVAIEGAATADVSWPGFFDALEALWS